MQIQLEPTYTNCTLITEDSVSLCYNPDYYRAYKYFLHNNYFRLQDIRHAYASTYTHIQDTVSMIMQMEQIHKYS